MAHIPDTQFRYEQLDDGSITHSVNELISLFNGFIEAAGYPKSTSSALFTRVFLLAEAVERVDKRADYYWYFHGIQISEKKRAALYAYWMVKFQPFVFVFRGDDAHLLAEKEYALINERFAAYLITLAAMIKPVGEKVGDANPDAIEDAFSSDFFDKLFYTLHYRNVNIDMIVTMTEGLTPATFELDFGGEEQ